MQDETNDRDRQAGGRKPYQPPRIEESSTFENLVLTCSHTDLDKTCILKKQTRS
jgi:hypothetical protein